MTFPIGSRVQVGPHWLVEGFTGRVVDHRVETRSLNRNDVLLDEPWVPTHSVNPEFCRRMFFADRDLTVLPDGEEH